MTVTFAERVDLTRSINETNFTMTTFNLKGKRVEVTFEPGSFG